MAEWDDPDRWMGFATVPDLEVWTAARAMWGGTYDPACEAREAVPARCFFGPIWYPHVSARMPTLVQQSSADTTFQAVHSRVNPMDDATRARWKVAAVMHKLVYVARNDFDQPPFIAFSM